MMDPIQSSRVHPLSITAFLLSAVLIVIIMMSASTTLIPIVIAIGIWLVLNDMTSFIHKFTIGRFQLPRWLAMTIGLLIILLLALRIVGLFVRSVTEFMNDLPTYTVNLEILLNTLPELIWVGLLGERADLSTGIVDQLFQYMSSFFSGYMSTIASSAATLASNIIYIAVYVIFLLLEQHTFAPKAHYMFSGNERRAEFQQIMDSIHEQVQTYITVKTVVSLILAAVSYGFMLLFGLEYAIIWAILIFILNFIPNIGSIIAIAFPLIMALLQFGDLFTVGGLLVALGIVQVAVGYFIEPRMMGRQMNISPFVVLVALGVFGVIWGIVGMFLSVPLTVILMIVFSHFDSTRPLAVLLSGDGVVYGIEADV